MDVQSMKFLAAGMAHLGLAVTAVMVGLIWTTLIKTVGRNPACKESVELFGWVGFATTEAIGLYSLVVALITLFS